MSESNSNQVDLINHYARYSATNIVKSSINDDKLIETIAMLLELNQEMYTMLESVKGELFQLIDEVNDQRMGRVNSQTETQPDMHDQEALYLIDKLLAKARGEQ